MAIEHETLYIIEFTAVTSLFDSDNYNSTEYEFMMSTNKATLFSLSTDPYHRFAYSADRPSVKTSSGVADILEENEYYTFNVEPTGGEKANVEDEDYDSAMKKLAELLKQYNSIGKAKHYTGLSADKPFETAEALANHKGFPDLIVCESDNGDAGKPQFLAEVKASNDFISESQDNFFRKFFEQLPIAKIEANGGIEIDKEPQFENTHTPSARCPSCDSLCYEVDHSIKDKDCLGFKCSDCQTMFIQEPMVSIIECDLCGKEHAVEDNIGYGQGRAFCSDTGDYTTGEIELVQRAYWNEYSRWDL